MRKTAIPSDLLPQTLSPRPCPPDPSHLLTLVDCRLACTCFFCSASSSPCPSTSPSIPKKCKLPDPFHIASLSHPHSLAHPSFTHIVRPRPIPLHAPPGAGVQRAPSRSRHARHGKSRNRRSNARLSNSRSPASAKELPSPLPLRLRPAQNVA